ncbi:transposase [Streptomyces sp. NPDC097610]|uniref:transposase n=1 Tax=Streptomyces sp. NPDC097610 TaxID=3157227 RepID=UPI00332CD5DC
MGSSAPLPQPCHAVLARLAGDPPHVSPAPGRSPDGHPIRAEVEYGREPEKTCVCGALRVWDAHEVTVTASSRSSAFYQQFLQKLGTAHPAGDIYVVTDNPSSHNSLSTRTWLEEHPRIRHVFIPVGACWLNLQERWWRIFRGAALAGQSFAGPYEIEQATHLAASQLNARARSWM